jgi:uncharacterized protein (DUF169 family)
MNTNKKYQEFMKCLGATESPIVAYYSNELPEKYIGPKGGFEVNITGPVDAVKNVLKFDKILEEKNKSFHCAFEYIMKTRKSKIPSVFSYENFGCLGFKFYSGYSNKLPTFNNYFVSTGIPGLHKGERLFSNPTSAKNSAKKLEGRDIKGKFLIFTCYDKLDENITPDVIIFFGNPETITGLIGMTRFVTGNDDGVHSIYCSGCTSIFAWPMQFKKQNIDEAVLGIFDIAARPYLNLGELSIAFSNNLFLKFLNNYKKSFLFKYKQDDKDVIFNWKDTRKRSEKLNKKISDRNNN